MGLSEVEIRKGNPGETVSLKAQYDNEGMPCRFASAAGPEVSGFRFLVHNGVAVEIIKR